MTAHHKSFARVQSTQRRVILSGVKQATKESTVEAKYCRYYTHTASAEFFCPCCRSVWLGRFHSGGSACLSIEKNRRESYFVSRCGASKAFPFCSAMKRRSGIYKPWTQRIKEKQVTEIVRPGKQKRRVERIVTKKTNHFDQVFLHVFTNVMLQKSVSKKRTCSILSQNKSYT